MIRLSLILGLLGFVGCSTTRNYPDYTKIISNDYLTSDSLRIRIVYTSIPSCIEFNQGLLAIGYYKGRSTIVHSPYRKSHEIIEIDSGRIVEDVRKFEVQGKYQQKFISGCSRQDGIQVSLFINEDSTTFGFCRENWDGIEELLQDLIKRGVN